MFHYIIQSCSSNSQLMAWGSTRRQALSMCCFVSELYSLCLIQNTIMYHYIIQSCMKIYINSSRWPGECEAPGPSYVLLCVCAVAGRAPQQWPVSRQAARHVCVRQTGRLNQSALPLHWDQRPATLYCLCTENMWDSPHKGSVMCGCEQYDLISPANSLLVFFRLRCRRITKVS